MRATNWIVLAIAIAVGACDRDTTTQATLDFRGIPFGASEKEFMDKNPTFLCAKDDKKTAPTRFCQIGGPLVDHSSSAFTFGGAQALFISATFYEDRFGSLAVFIRPEDFDTVSAALREKFGKPDSLIVQKTHTMMGVQLENPLAIWKLRGGTVIAERYTSEITRGSVVYTDERLASERREREAQAQKGRPTGL